MKKPWSQMTDDEKLIAIFQFVLSFGSLFVVQFICVVVLTFTLGMATPADIPVGSPRQWLNFAPALVGIPLATLFFAWQPLRKSGRWIWLPGALIDVYDSLRGGLHDAPHHLYQQISGESPIAILRNVPVVACIFYPLTMFAMNQLMKRFDPQSKPVSSVSNKQGPGKVFGPAPPQA